MGITPKYLQRHKVLILDGYNLIHRARSGFTKGDNAIVFNFFRGLKSILEKFPSDTVYFVLEGVPKKNIEMISGYKSSRKRADDSFYRQKDKIIGAVEKYFPISSVVHENFECDDTAATIAKEWADMGSSVTIISSDTDFIQSLQWEISNSGSIELYSPVKKKFIEAPDYNYVEWKSIVGDKTDDIPGVRGYGPKKSEKVITDTKTRHEFMKIAENKEIYERNLQVIGLTIIDKSNEHYGDGIKLLNPSSFDKFDEIGTKTFFEECEFTSMLKDVYFSKLKAVFQALESNMTTRHEKLGFKEIDCV